MIIRLQKENEEEYQCVDPNAPIAHKFTTAEIRCFDVNAPKMFAGVVAVGGRQARVAATTQMGRA